MDQIGTPSKVLTVESIPKRVLNAEYAVRGELVMKAEQHAKTIVASKMSKEKNPLPFDEIIYCNIGNPQALMQVPITFFRQVISEPKQ